MSIASNKAYIENILNGNIQNQSKKIYNYIDNGVSNIGSLCNKLKLPKSTLTARLDRLETNGLVTKLGKGVYKGTTFTKYVIVPTLEIEHFANEYKNKKLIKRLNSLVSMDILDKDIKQVLKEYQKELEK